MYLVRVFEIVSAHEAGRTITALSRESPSYPQSLTKEGTMHYAIKTDLVDLAVSREQRVVPVPVIDGAAFGS